MAQPTILQDDDAFDHLASAVRLHREQLPGGFITSLGDRFLLEVFRNIARSRHGVALVAVGTGSGDDAVEGFLFGATSTGGLYRDFILRRGWKAALFAAPRLLHPSNLRKVWETFRYPAQAADFEAPPAELLDLAVSDPAKGTGLAQRLFDRFVAELERRGHRAFRVTTGASLTRAHRFYEKQGAVRVGTIEIHHGEATHVYAYGEGYSRDGESVEEPTP